MAKLYYYVTKLKKCFTFLVCVGMCWSLYGKQQSYLLPLSPALAAHCIYELLHEGENYFKIAAIEILLYYINTVYIDKENNVDVTTACCSSSMLYI